MLDGKITRMDADDAFAGDIASMNFDFPFTMVPNAFKQKDSHPDYVIEVQSPRGRTVRIGSAWSSTSRAGNDYFSLALNMPQGVIRANAVQDEEAGPGEYRIIPQLPAAA
ncbi:DUF736 family protein [Ruegeria sp. HKCCD8929]|uniref:DUF736 domain-containing protein n=1 Tax=Ruegeria sp. HKCCD8929 TaxID=2683006 RepID=UPI0014877F6C|nr:DUF736 family protein [Ruegeria sp. HKCCD8929]